MKPFLFAIALFFALQPAFSQDYILTRAGDELQAKVLEITLTEVKYKRYDNLEGPLISLPKSGVMMIKYENGEKELFQEAVAPEAPVMAPQEAYSRGQMDAIRSYRGSGAKWGTYGLTVAFPPAALVGGVVMGLTPPRVDPFMLPDQQLRDNQSYIEGYRKQAGRRKWGKIAGGFGLGLLTNVVILSILVNNSQP